MSAGKTIIVGYESYLDEGGIYRVRIQPETAVASLGLITNSPPVGSPNRAGLIRVSAPKNGAGLKPRLLYLKLALGSEPPPDYSLDSKTCIPALTEVFYKTVIVARQVEYLNTLWIVTGGRPEYLR